jgi:hypothetical protein
MKEYYVKYELAGTGFIRVTARNEEDAQEEIDRIFAGDEPIHEDNQWIDQDVLWDIEWDKVDTISAEEV